MFLAKELIFAILHVLIIYDDDWGCSEFALKKEISRQETSKRVYKFLTEDIMSQGRVFDVRKMKKLKKG
jgi:hypothetical protein